MFSCPAFCRLALTATAIAADKSIRKQMSASATEDEDPTAFGAAGAAEDMEDLQVRLDSSATFASQNTSQSDSVDHESFDIVRMAELICSSEHSLGDRSKCSSSARSGE